MAWRLREGYPVPVPDHGPLFLIPRSFPGHGAYDRFQLPDLLLQHGQLGIFFFEFFNFLIQLFNGIYQCYIDRMHVEVEISVFFFSDRFGKNLPHILGYEADVFMFPRQSQGIVFFIVEGDRLQKKDLIEPFGVNAMDVFQANIRIIAPASAAGFCCRAVDNKQITGVGG